jgi:hypothetical protein
VARNALALALLTAIALSGCSTIKGVLQGDKEEKAAQAKLTVLRARTDSLRKARRVADSLAQVRYVACADSVRAAMTKPPAAVRTRKKKKPVAPPSNEMILARTQAACGSDRSVPQPTLAASDAAAKRIAADSAASAIAAPTTKRAQPSPAPAAPPPAPETPAPRAKADAPVVQESVAADSAQKSKELEMVRETFAYSGSTRDPFNSLLNMAKTGPELADLQLVGIYQNLRTPDASVAVFREKDGGKRHKLRAGDQVGRSRLIQIRDREVVFVIEDFGFERQETLSLRKQEDVVP